MNEIRAVANKAWVLRNKLKDQLDPEPKLGVAVGSQINIDAPIDLYDYLSA
ncbi:MAG: hypothetical protein HOB14_06610 [Gammaproteobacteria bacterium]|jgi:hypothetical protein|nr:hypothetical protein [Gammaproteobacteria bacterium]MBT4077890.1 hypothetical protein [Gammaproteobacteria bacterium]MBT4449093.1 hypothetical protein [Gammaproteobacteria bacterium]MBT4859643.1 hypothetical protein [Gammaproteobacteria bacterium]MBT6456271.1 hypothetical protein [Gammaproteobacteria bacterium]